MFAICWVENGMRQSPQQMANMLCANMPYLAANFFHYNHKEHLAKEDLL